MNPTTDSGRYDALLCYNNVDVEQVRRLHAALGIFGIACWADFDQPMAGSYWRQRVKEGFAQSDSAIVVLGATGLGKSQADEVMYYIDSARRENKRLLFVLLQGANLSEIDEIGARGISVIQAKEFADEIDVVHTILRVLKPDAMILAQSLGFFRGLKPRPRSCFLALPRVVEHDLLPVFQEVASGLRCTVVQDADATQAGFDSDELTGVANTSIVLADGRCMDGTSFLDPAVAHVLGIARAYGKPIIIVMNPNDKPKHPTFVANRPIDYDPAAPNALPELKQQLATSITEILSSMSYHGMLAPDAKDMLVVFHGALRLSPAQWKIIAQVVGTCRLLADAFCTNGHILSALSTITNQADAAEDEWPARDEASRWWREFCKSFDEQFCRHYVGCLIPLMKLWAERELVLESSIAQLAASEKDPVARVFTNARDFLGLMAKGIKRFDGVYEILVPKCAPRQTLWPLGPDWYHKQLIQMREYADDVVTNALATISSFLPLLGYELDQFPGAKCHGSDQHAVTVAL